MSQVQHDTKDWHNNTTTTMPETPIQTPPVAAVDSPPRHTCSSDEDQQKESRPTSDNHEAMQYHHEQQQDQQESDDTANRLPGMIAQSQPATPHPDRIQQEEYQGGATSPRNNVVRGRSGFFADELGPVFGPTESLENIYSFDRSTTYQVDIQGKIDKGFFMADDDWTCYRRNYFQISSVFSIHGGYNNYDGNPLYVVDVQTNQLTPITRFLMGVSARVANSDKQIELIQHTPKRDKGPQYRPEPKPLAPGGNLNSTSSSQQNSVTFERLQYKTATANNGKRRAAQQYYVCHVDLYAQMENNLLVKVATSPSSPLVVRGRSPGHYADNERGVTSQQERVFTSYTKTKVSQARQKKQQGHEEHEEAISVQHPLPPPPMMKYEYNGPTNSSNTTPPPMAKYEYNGGPTSSNSTPYPYYQPAPVYSYAPSNAAVPHLPSPYAQPHHYGVPEDPYAQYHHHHHEEQHKMMHYPIAASPHYDWQRTRYNSSSSGSSSAPSPGGGPYSEAANNHYFASPHSGGSDTRSSTYSPTTPTYNNVPVGGVPSAVARKYTGVPPNLMNNN